jgi:hypothetical protein
MIVLRIQLDKENQPLNKFFQDKIVVEKREVSNDFRLSGSQLNKNLEIPRKEVQTRIPKK